MTSQEKQLHTLIPLEDFKTVLCLDDWDDKISTFCLVSATYTIEQYEIFPVYGIDIDLPFHLSLSPALRRYRRLSAIKVVYTAGYDHGKVPPDLASACIE